MENRSDIEALGRVAEAWLRGWLAGDVEALMALYAEEPVLLPQGRKPVVGRAAIRALYEPLLRDYRFESRSRVEEIAASGDLGFIWSSYALTAVPVAGGAPIAAEGKSVFLLRREPDGAWRIARLIDNSDIE